MILFHGSKLPVERPDVLHSRKRVDFGSGFYVTPIYDQAKNLCKRFLTLGNAAYISKYQLDDEVLQSETKIIQFDTYSEEWLDFVFSCRQGQDTSDYDIVIGGVADDKVFDTVELFFQGMITKDTAMGRLHYEKPNSQVCIRTQDVIDRYLHFEGSEKL